MSQASYEYGVRSLRKDFQQGKALSSLSFCPVSPWAWLIRNDYSVHTPPSQAQLSSAAPFYPDAPKANRVISPGPIAWPLSTITHSYHSPVSRTGTATTATPANVNVCYARRLIFVRAEVSCSRPSYLISYSLDDGIILARQPPVSRVSSDTKPGQRTVTSMMDDGAIRHSSVSYCMP
jgi:hypothetical protein